MVQKLTPDFYLQGTLTVARSLIGCFLVRRTEQGDIVGRISETEGYIGLVDKACHAYPDKRTMRTEPLFHAGGIAYVYLVYGMYHCLNVVSEGPDIPCAVLIRGAEMVKGAELAAVNRYGKGYETLSKREREHLADGPGKLCRAFDIDKTLNFEDLRGERLFLCDTYHGHIRQAGRIEESRRIGIDYAEEAREFLWRFRG